MAEYMDNEDGVKGQPPEMQRIDDVLRALGVENTQENMAQMGVYLEAFAVFIERNRRHRAQWRVGGLQGLLVDIRKKCERMWNEYMLSPVPPEDNDSAIDMINYLSFFVQARREEKERGAKVGTWIWPTLSRDEAKRGMKTSLGLGDLRRQHEESQKNFARNPAEIN